MSVSTKLDKNFLLPISHVGLPYFRHSDTEQLFLKNIKTKPEEWAYRFKKIRYTVNKEGYRAKDWAESNWEDSVLVLGCSHVFGIGVDDCETLPRFLSNELGCDTINLGFPAGSSTNILYNSLRILEQNIKPKSVVCIFPSTGRDSYFHSDHVKNLGAWVEEKGFYTTPEVNYIQGFLSNESNIVVKNYINETSCRLLWEQSGVDFFGFVHTFEERFRSWPKLSEPIDYARDDKHYGPKTYSKWAKEIKDYLN